jgi:lactate dehydrogenase-like 2-hydroxyacid dehydrogenase
MTKLKIFITGAIPDQGLDQALDKYDTEIWPKDTPPTKKELLKKVRGIDGLLSLLTSKIDAEVMDAAGKQLKVISNYAVGYDNIDVQAATKRGILVTNTPGVLTETTADLAFALLMAAARRIVEGADYVREGKWHTWNPKLLLGLDIHQATLGIVGLGRIGKAMVRRARGFNMKILYYDEKGRYDKDEEIGALYCETMDEILKYSDFLSLHVPLTPETHHLIDAKALKKMKQTAILINTSRGSVVDPDALYNALKNGDIAYAALDVTEPEPIPANHKLLSLSNCLIVPHIGSASVMTRGLMADMAVENLLAVLRGDEPKYLVNPEVLKAKKN